MGADIKVALRGGKIPGQIVWPGILFHIFKELTHNNTWRLHGTYFPAKQEYETTHEIQMLPERGPVFYNYISDRRLCKIIHQGKAIASRSTAWPLSEE